MRFQENNGTSGPKVHGKSQHLPLITRGLCNNVFLASCSLCWICPFLWIFKMPLGGGRSAVRYAANNRGTPSLKLAGRKGPALEIKRGPSMLA